jgi:hypothetical protein
MKPNRLETPQDQTLDSGVPAPAARSTPKRPHNAFKPIDPNITIASDILEESFDYDFPEESGVIVID